MNPRRIGISLGNIGALHDGLGEFASQIGQRVAAVAPAWRERYGVAIDFHLREKFSGLFGNDVGYLHVNRWHRVRHAQPEPYALWHSLHQLNKNLPPLMQPDTHARLTTVHDLNYLYEGKSYSSWRRHRLALALMQRSDEVVAISQATANDVRQHLGWTGPLHVIHNGARSFVEQPRRPLPGWEMDDKRVFLYHLSRMSPSKNPQAILDLARHWPEMTFVLCGPPSEEAKHLRLTTRLPNVQIHLGIDDSQKAWAYAHCAGFLFPSIAEGFGLPPIEAMHFGKPVFLARRSCLPEIGGNAAEYFDTFDPAAMRAVVERGLALDDEPGHAKAIQAHAARFDWDRAAQAYMAIYRRLLALPPG